MNWDSLHLNRKSPVPLYYQLVEQIRQSIRAGHLSEGVRLPAERDIADRAEISRMTVRQALVFLEREGMLSVQPGVGTFVAAPKLTYDALHLVGFAEETMRQGGAVVSRVIGLTIDQPPPSVTSRLQLPKEASVIKIVRLRSAGGDPVVLETSYIRMDGCAGLEHEDLEAESLYSLLETRFGLQLANASQTVEAHAASEFEAEVLDIHAGVPVLIAEGVTFTVEDQPIEYFKAVYRADRVSLAMESRRPTDSKKDSGSSHVSVVVAP